MQAVEENPYVIPIVKEADATLNFGGGWHTDSSYQAIPPEATVLYAVEVPEEGGDTKFANATAAFDALSDGMKETWFAGVASSRLSWCTVRRFLQQKRRELRELLRG